MYTKVRRIELLIYIGRDFRKMEDNRRTRKEFKKFKCKKEKNIRKRREYKKWKRIQHKKRNRIYEMKENIRIEREYMN